MSLDRTTVKAFLQPTLACKGSASCSDVVALIQQYTGRDPISHSESTPQNSIDTTRLVLIDQTNQALGLVSTTSVLSDWLISQSLTPVPSKQETRVVPQTIAEFTASTLEPLIVLPDNLTLPKFWQHLSQFSLPHSTHWVIVDHTNGEFLGLLDTPRVLQTLAKEFLYRRLENTHTEAQSGPGEIQTHHRATNDISPVLTVPKPSPDDLLAAISHDLKTPLTAIIGLSNVLQDQRLGSLTERQARYIELIHQKGHQLITIVNALLDLTQIKSQRLTLFTHDIEDLQSLCENAIAQALRRYHLEGHQSDLVASDIQLNVADNRESLVADELRLQQTLVLLLCNGLFFGRDSGEIGLTVERWDQWFAFTVWDTGTVIPSHQQHLIFQTPLALDSALEQSLIPTGLNLILAQQLAHLQGGDITFLPQTQKGNKFTLLMPPLLPQSKTDTFTPATLSDRFILIVASAPQLIVALSQQLTDLGYQVIIAHSCAEALEKCLRIGPKLIVLHLPLPLVSRWEGLTQLKQHPQISRVPIIVIGEPQDESTVRQKGAEGFIALPLVDSVLESCLRTWFPGSRLEKSQVRLTQQTPQLSSQASPQQPAAITQRPQPAANLNLTVLHLDINPSSMSAPNTTPSQLADISRQLHRYGCRVIAVDDLEQAELLTQIWHPNVILYSSTDTTLLNKLPRDSLLVDLPFVVIDADSTNSVKQPLEQSIFICPLSSSMQALDPDRAIATLLQTLQTAAGTI